MSCTTLLVGCKATNDGSTIVARNEDCENGAFNAKSMVVVKPENQPRTYTSVASHLTMELPDNPLRYVCVPNADRTDGIWGEAGINAANVSMTATETISSNARVLGADPLVCYQPAQGTPGQPGYQAETPGGIGEENLVTIILPYIKSAKEGVLRMGKLLEQYGTYEMNGVAFGDESEIWYIESVGGHHWIARRVPDDAYVAQPNRLGIDKLDLRDALGAQKDYMCSSDLAKWMCENHLDMDIVPLPEANGEKVDGVAAVFDPRKAFSSYTWLDIVYNCPRKWFMCSVLNPSSPDFSGPDAKYGPQSMEMPWAVVPESKISAMDVKNILSSTYDGTEFNCYDDMGTQETRNRYRYIGINRTCECSILCIRPYAPDPCKGVQWVAFGSGPFNTAIAMYSNVDSIPEYLNTALTPSTDDFYWENRIVAALADPEFFQNYEAIQSYQQQTLAKGYEMLSKTDEEVQKSALQGADAVSAMEKSNQQMSDFVQKQNNALLASVLFNRSLNMKNSFGVNDH